MIATEEELVFVGAIFDLYGEVRIIEREDKKFTLKLCIELEHRPTLEKVRDYLNLGNVRIGKRGIGRSRRPAKFIYSVYNYKAVEVINIILPYTHTKKDLLEETLTEVLERKRQKRHYADMLKEIQKRKRR